MIKYGLNSSISVPILICDDVIAALSIYSVDEDFFDQDEVDLILDMVTNLSLAIEKNRQFRHTQDTIKK